MNDTPGPSILVIGYGNTLRGDDGVGPRVAEGVAKWGLPTVRALGVHQLTPELAEPLAAADLAIFVDARVPQADATVRVEPLAPAAHMAAISHSGDPRSLLGLARIAFGRSPRAWSITIPANATSIGTHLSLTAEHGVKEALEHIAHLVRVYPETRFFP